MARRKRASFRPSPEPDARPSHGSKSAAKRWLLCGAIVVTVVGLTLTFWPTPQPIADSLAAPDAAAQNTKAPKSSETAAAPLALPATRTGRHRNTAPQVAYVGTARCVECHEGEHRSFLHTPHSQALGKMGDAAEPPPGQFTHARSTLSYATIQNGATHEHEVTLRDTDGSVIVQHRYPIAYHIGSGNHSRSYLLADGPFLFESPLTWYRVTDAWGLSPGYDRPLPRGFDRLVDQGCLACHAGRIEAIDDNRFHARVVEGTIGCESCHGPGQLHIDHWRDRARPAEAGHEDLTIVNPARLSRDESEQICSACHLRGVATSIVRGKRLADLRPGLPLADFRIDYFADTGDDDMKVTGHFEQMRRSKCYQASAEMNCLSCHDPHARPTPEQRLSHFRQKCLECHEQACKLDVATRTAQQADDDCSACHMPRGNTDLPHFAFTHHRVGIHDLKKRTKTSTQRNAELVESPAKLIASGPVDHLSEPDQWRCLGLAYVEYSEKQRTSTAAETCRDTGRRYLRQAVAQGIRDAATLATLAGLELEHGQTDDARRLAREALEHPNLESGGHENARFVLANIHLQAERFAEAEQELRHVVRQRYRVEDWLMLANVQQRQSRNSAALDSLRAAEKLNPFRPDVQNRLAAAYAQSGDDARAAQHRKLERRLLSRLAEPAKP